jgi:hypothetical protein
MKQHPDDVTLDAWAEGTLADAERAALDAHLAECGRCRAEAERQRALLASLRALPARVDPGVDLRPAIRAELARRTSAPGRWSAARSLRVPLAAAALLLIAVTATITTLLLSDRAGRDDVVAVDRERDDVTLASFDQERADYVRTADELSALLERHRDRLEPETVALVEQNLRTIEQALREAEVALLADPASPVIHEMILATHQKKVEVLRWANDLVRG